MPRTPTIFFNKRDFELLEKKVETKGFSSMYAYMKDLLEKEIGIEKPVTTPYK